jgi:hypothetical protein
VRAHPVHFVEQSFPFAIQIAFDAQCREFVGDYSYAPPWRIFAPAIASINQDFRGRFGFLPGAKRAILAVRGYNAFAQEFVGALAAFGGNNNPAPCDWILPQLRQRFLLD